MATGAAIDYLTSLDMEQIHEHEIHLTELCQMESKIWTVFQS